MRYEFIPAYTWRQMSTLAILQSIDIASRVLADRKLSRKDLQAIFNIAVNLLEVIGKKLA